MIARHCIRLLPAIAAILLVLGTGIPARAQNVRCVGGLRDCYGFAAGRVSFWDMWLAGIDCEIDFADCVRREVVGR